VTAYEFVELGAAGIEAKNVAYLKIVAWVSATRVCKFRKIEF
jgi:hypothetical protein